MSNPAPPTYEEAMKYMAEQPPMTPAVLLDSNDLKETIIDLACGKTIASRKIVELEIEITRLRKRNSDLRIELDTVRAALPAPKKK